MAESIGGTFLVDSNSGVWNPVSTSVLEAGLFLGARRARPPWTPEEDVLLLQHVAKNGTKKWATLQANGVLPSRDQKACCNRFILLKRRAAKEGLPGSLSRILKHAQTQAIEQDSVDFPSTAGAATVLPAGRTVGLEDDSPPSDRSPSPPEPMLRATVVDYQIPGLQGTFEQAGEAQRLGAVRTSPLPSCEAVLESLVDRVQHNLHDIDLDETSHRGRHKRSRSMSDLLLDLQAYGSSQRDASPQVETQRHLSTPPSSVRLLTWREVLFSHTVPQASAASAIAIPQQQQLALAPPAAILTDSQIWGGVDSLSLHGSAVTQSRFQPDHTVHQTSRSSDSSSSSWLNGSSPSTPTPGFSSSCLAALGPYGQQQQQQLSRILHPGQPSQPAPHSPLHNHLLPAEIPAVSSPPRTTEWRLGAGPTASVASNITHAVTCASDGGGWLEPSRLLAPLPSRSWSAQSLVLPQHLQQECLAGNAWTPPHHSGKVARHSLPSSPERRLSFSPSVSPLRFRKPWPPAPSSPTTHSQPLSPLSGGTASSYMSTQSLLHRSLLGSPQKQFEPPAASPQRPVLVSPSGSSASSTISLLLASLQKDAGQQSLLAAEETARWRGGERPHSREADGAEEGEQPLIEETEPWHMELAKACLQVSASGARAHCTGQGNNALPANVNVEAGALPKGAAVLAPGQWPHELLASFTNGAGCIVLNQGRQRANGGGTGSGGGSGSGCGRGPPTHPTASAPLGDGHGSLVGFIPLQADGSLPRQVSVHPGTQDLASGGPPGVLPSLTLMHKTADDHVTEGSNGRLGSAEPLDYGLGRMQMGASPGSGSGEKDGAQCWSHVYLELQNLLDQQHGK